MSDINKDFEEKLKAEIFREADEIPESLSTDSIKQLISDKQPAKVKGKAYKKIIAVAASFAIVLTAAVAGIKYYNPKVKPINPSNSNKLQTAELSGISYEDDYKSIQDFFISYRNNNRYYTIKEYFDGVVSFNSGASKTASVVEEAVGADGSINVPSTAVPNGSTPGYESDETGLGGGPASETEVQVAGVDEADIIKNDGRYIFVANHRDWSKITIIDTQNTGALNIVSEIQLTSNADTDISCHEFFIKGNLLIVAAQIYGNETGTFGNLNDSAICIEPNSGNNRCAIIVYDITDKANPELVSKYELDGFYTTSRLIGNNVILVSGYAVPLYKDDQALKEACIPTYTLNSKDYKFPADRIGIIDGNEDNQYTLVLKIDISKDSSEPECAAVLGSSGEVYCNETDLYVARWCYEEKGNDIYEEYTEIYRFDIKDGVTFKSKGRVKGDVLNQFSMDEYDGYLRIATCNHNEQTFITVLDKDLNIISCLDGIAKGESIYAVRFIGDTAYVVTFFQTDPLFVIDLSDPHNPKIAGELKIPGFSNMLYPYGDNYLIGIGVDGDENGTNGMLKISLFDISDKAQPKEISKAVISGWYYSEAQYNHKAFVRFSDTGEFMIPVSGGAKSYLCTFSVNDGKISAYKRYMLENPIDCNRGIFIGDKVFALYFDGITSFDRNTCQVLNSVNFPFDYNGVDPYREYYNHDGTLEDGEIAIFDGTVAVTQQANG